MGLTGSVDRGSLWTAAMLIAALVLDLSWAPPDPEGLLAQRWLGAGGRRIELECGPAFQLGARWLLFFEQRGKVAPFRGAVLIEDERIRDLLLFEAYEGVGRSAFSDRRLANSLCDQPARAPVDALVVSGATVSSQLLIDAIDDCLSLWRSAVR
ncbi:MAG: hypothetical protein CMJ84_01275 [Planctomycetes bacterium]|jgi:hypothetical protein|nr:hypothetical protein [Planctomycetota bacterium]MDP6408865.1 hypothetical protein [Planctomycetota bacterium]